MEKEEKEWAEEGIKHQGTLKPCVAKGSWRKKHAAEARKGQRQRLSPAELSWGGASERRLIEVRRCLGPWEAIGRISRLSPPPTSWPAPETCRRGEGWGDSGSSRPSPQRDSRKGGREGGS